MGRPDHETETGPWWESEVFDVVHEIVEPKQSTNVKNEKRSKEGKKISYSSN